MTAQQTQRPTTAIIDLDNLAFNFHSVKRFVGAGVSCMAVVKANAYGHGAVPCALRLEREGADWFAVALVEEAVELREAGISKPILCFGVVWPGHEQAILRHDITPAIFQMESAERLNNAAAAVSQTVNIHVKIDTGMGRVGVPHSEAREFAERLTTLSNLNVEGVMTHFAAADDLSENEFTATQTRRLDEAVAVFRGKGFTPKYTDSANSPGAVAHPESRRNMVRIGGVLYGLGGDVLPAGIEKPELKPVMSVLTEIAQIKRVSAGASLGYGRTFITERDSVIGTIPLGYHDGYRRSLSNRGRVLVHGKFAPVVGRISMDWTIVDLTHVHEAKIGDQVIVIGEQDGSTITAEELAANIGTISYEVTCGISSRVPRVYVG